MQGNIAPELVHRALGAHDHACAAGERVLREDAAPGAGRPDVHPEMAKRLKRAVLGHGEKAPQPAPGQILQKDALDRILSAEGKNLVERRRAELRHLRILPEQVAYYA